MVTGGGSVRQRWCAMIVPAMFFFAAALLFTVVCGWLFGTRGVGDVCGFGGGREWFCFFSLFNPFLFLLASDLLWWLEGLCHSD
ncbi:unnamed protein product [Trifolium pratense]|uniref:Uncharacterized protein n=1 Tax=Trifolium pratense TaxID=57577 RepID=A0ACB0MFQ9_TRIPR|nr:unnamed protein product [Trifolium pratense]